MSKRCYYETLGCQKGADGATLPFAAQSFDLVIALGVLEHTDDPGAFLLEMARVGRRGLVHVPTTFTERIFYREFHTHTFALDGATLVIRRKRFADAFGGLFDYLAHFDGDFIRFVEKNRGLFNLEYAWQGRPSFRVEAYDAGRPTFAVFEKRYQGRPFEVRLPVSELLPVNVDAVLVKEPPRTWRPILSPVGSIDKYCTTSGSVADTAPSFTACSAPETMTSFAPLSLI